MKFSCLDSFVAHLLLRYLLFYHSELKIFILLIWSQIILSEDAVKEGGVMDMESVKTEEEMNAKMMNVDTLMVKAATGNVALQKRIVGMVEEAIERNIF